MTPIVAVVLGLVATCGLIGVVYALGAPRDRDVRRWASARGLELTEENVRFVDAYVRWGHGLRLVCCVGGYWASTSLAQGVGIDAHVPGELWALTGYLIGCLWSELWLTRLPAGTKRAASLRTRDLADYLPRRLRTAQVVLPAVTVAFAVWCASLDGGSGGAWLLSPQATVAHTALLAGWLAPALMVVVWLLQRWIVRRPQPLVEPSVLAADDAVRSSSVHLLSGTANAMVLVLVATQLGYLGTRRAGAGIDWLSMLAVALLASAFVGWRWYGHRAWRVRRAPLEASGAGAPVPVALIARRSPVVLAAFLAAVLIATGLTLRWWGPLNPEIAVSMEGTSIVGAVVPASTRAPARGRSELRLWLSNRSHAGVRVERVRTRWVSDSLEGPVPRSPVVAAVTARTALGSMPLPTSIRSGRTMELRVELATTRCLDTPFAPRYEVVADLRTAAGTTKTVVGSIPLSFPICPGHLDRVERGHLDPRPSGGVQPMHPTEVRAAIARSFATVYDFTAPPSARSALVDDPAGLERAIAGLQAGPYNPLTIHALVRDVVFTDPTHAVVGYELGAGSIRLTRRGSAVLRGGAWMVTRVTVCGDLALANARCP